MTSPTPNDILAIPMGDNDAKAATIGEYLQKLLLGVWTEGEGFSGKRPFGNSGWEFEVYAALAKAGIIEAEFDENGYINTFSIGEEEKANLLIQEAIKGAFST